MNVTASTRTHGFGHIIWKTGGEKSENSPEIEYLGNRMPHKINFHSLQFLKNCLHKTPENYCLLPATKNTPDYFVVRSRLLRRSFGPGLIASRLFTPTDFPARILWPPTLADAPTSHVHNHDAKPRRQTATPIHNIKPQHQATNIHNTRTQDSQQKSVHCHVGKNSYFCVIMSFK